MSFARFSPDGVCACAGAFQTPLQASCRTELLVKNLTLGEVISCQVAQVLSRYARATSRPESPSTIFATNEAARLDAVVELTPGSEATLFSKRRFGPCLSK